MIILSSKQIIALHSQLISETGGTDGIRDEGLLSSALNAPFQSFGDIEVYPSLFSLFYWWCQLDAKGLSLGLILYFQIINLTVPYLINTSLLMLSLILY